MQLTDDWKYISCSSKKDKQLDRFFNVLSTEGLLKVSKVMLQLTLEDFESEYHDEPINRECAEAVLYFLSHWMYICIAKQLLLLMTPEAFILHKDIGYA